LQNNLQLLIQLQNNLASNKEIKPYLYGKAFFLF